MSCLCIDWIVRKAVRVVEEMIMNNELASGNRTGRSHSSSKMVSDFSEPRFRVVAVMLLSGHLTGRVLVIIFIANRCL